MPMVMALSFQSLNGKKKIIRVVAWLARIMDGSVALNMPFIQSMIENVPLQGWVYGCIQERLYQFCHGPVLTLP